MGGGFHEIGRGGHLSVHADFNHHKLMDVERRVNVLIYLNDDWKDEYGGQLELWNEDMTEKVKSVVPLANRCVMFTTTGDSYHGNPNPITHPEGRTRKSIALYYYTSTWDEDKVSKTTQFKNRPGTEDRTDWHVRTQELLTEYLPPVLARPAKKAASRFIR
nr:2OG-Fe(II) oxygenase [Parvularcula dongshanensis]